jgi:hypothetical protein
MYLYLDIILKIWFVFSFIEGRFCIFTGSFSFEKTRSLVLIKNGCLTLLKFSKAIIHLSGLNSFGTSVFVEKHAPGSYEKARLRFAHAETVVPFSCLLGLFREGSGECLTF